MDLKTVRRKAFNLDTFEVNDCNNDYKTTNA